MNTSAIHESTTPASAAPEGTETVRIDPSEAPVLRAFGQEMRLLLAGDQTGGRCTVLLDLVPPGLGTPPHYHTREDEAFHVLDGRAAFWRGGGWEEVPVGTTVFAPRGVVHGFQNIGTSPLRVLITLTPSGFEKWFARCAEAFASTREPDLPQLAALAAEHGMHFPAPVTQ